MNEIAWAVGRATGLTALALLTLSLLLGVWARSGRRLAGVERFAVQTLHRRVALGSVVFVAVHVVSLMFDSYAKLTPIDAVLPGLAELSPLSIGLGTVGFDLMIAVAVTGLLRHRIGPRAFRVVHWATYALWPISVLHGIGIGSDLGGGKGRVAVIVAASAVAALVVWRALPHFAEHGEARS